MKKKVKYLACMFRGLEGYDFKVEYYGIHRFVYVMNYV